MIQHMSIEEIRQLEENARNLRSEAIFEMCASLFKAIGSGIIGLAANVGKKVWQGPEQCTWSQDQVTLRTLL